MDGTKLKCALEAILFASGDPIPAARVSLALGVPEDEVQEAAAALAREYEDNGRGIRLLRLESALQLCSAPEYAGAVTRAIEHRAPPRLSPPALEALAVIAYFQPVTRAYVEQVRGTDSAYTVGSLAEKGLIEPCGRLEAPGRPMLYRTTDAFLRVMGLRSLEELPPLPDLSAADGPERLQNAIEAQNGRGDQLAIELPENEPGGESF